MIKFTLIDKVWRILFPYLVSLNYIMKYTKCIIVVKGSNLKDSTLNYNMIHNAHAKSEV
jgi:hypothetical protein